MATKNKEFEMFTFDQIKDEFIGEIGTEKRTHYEQELQLEMMGEMIKKVRLERNLTQEELGKLIGVQRAQISKLENNTTNVTMETILKVFGALKAKVNFNVELLNNKIKIAGQDTTSASIGFSSMLANEKIPPAREGNRLTNFFSTLVRNLNF